MSTQSPRSGAQYDLRAGDYEATIVAVGASVRSLTYRGRDLILPFDADELRPSFRGCVLAPWPNRVAGGRWTWRGHELQLPLTEPARGHSLHGLVAWQEWVQVSVAADSVTLATVVAAQVGYPFRLELTMTWSLGADGLLGRLVARNTGADDAPWACSIHPYLVAPGRLDDWTLHLPASSELRVDDSLIPTNLVPVLAEHDFRVPRRIGATTLDHTFTGFDEDERATVTDSAGVGTEIQFDASSTWVQVCTSDWPAEPGHRAGVAIEPMTCPPNALATGMDLVLLDPGEQHSTQWRLRALGTLPGGR